MACGLDGDKIRFEWKYPEGFKPKKPSKKAANERVFDIDAEFVASEKKNSGNLLCDPDGYAYVQNRHQGGVVYWRCRTHYKQGCKATAVTVGRKLHKIIGEHTNHHILKVHGNLGRMRDGDGRGGKWIKGSGVKDKMKQEGSTLPE